MMSGSGFAQTSSIIEYSFSGGDSLLSKVVDVSEEDFMIEVVPSKERHVIIVVLYELVPAIKSSLYYSELLAETNRKWISNEGKVVPIIYSFEWKMLKDKSLDVIMSGHGEASLRYDWYHKRVITYKVD
ncbi:hypothetical protein [Owenweeksia hongkongensis]|uniref:hypothetical protein n=1 Tax=Owenweeksia hongkongensis TaxID=253245 RepID=UPI003A94B861